MAQVLRNICHVSRCHRQDTYVVMTAAYPVEHAVPAQTAVPETIDLTSGEDTTV